MTAFVTALVTSIIYAFAPAIIETWSEEVDRNRAQSLDEDTPTWTGEAETDGYLVVSASTGTQARVEIEDCGVGNTYNVVVATSTGGVATLKLSKGRCWEVRLINVGSRHPYLRAYWLVD